jgi:hypothetical protein
MIQHEIEILQAKAFILSQIALAKAIVESTYLPPVQQESIISESRTVVVKGKDLL